MSRRRQRGATGSPDVALPVAGQTHGVRRSRSAPWRAVVLIAVNLAMIAHLVHWRLAGSTLAPLEPSEAMAFSTDNIINAGFVLFALAALSTLVFGRFFCGWGCHVVALQDLCRWMLAKLGIRPRPLRSRLLMLVPLGACIYMFAVPLVYRLLLPQQPPLTAHWTTTEFWATFPAWFIAVVTFVVCGFVMVYFLGAKGFCTYGCPYGALFGVVEQLAPARIRVTDACEGCGHCTAVCTSNVRVHEEVRDFKMVVDPGCMRCMDCVSVCPNDALYLGIGRPAWGAAVPVKRRSATPWWWWLASFAFLSALIAVSMLDRGVQPAYALGGGLGGTLLLAALRIKGSPRRPAHSFAEEVVLGILFLMALAVFRGLHVSVPAWFAWGIAGRIPFLCALGIAALLATFGLQFMRLWYRRDCSMRRVVLRRAGRCTTAGWVFAAVMTAVIAGCVYLGSVQWHVAALTRTVAGLPGFGWYREPGVKPAPEYAAAVAVGLEHARRIPLWARVGHHTLDRDMAQLYLLGPEDEGLRTHLASVRQALNLPSADAYGDLGSTLALRGWPADADRVYGEGLYRYPDHPPLWFRRGLLVQRQGANDLAIAAFARAVQLKPDYVEARENLAGTLCEVGRFAECAAEFGQALLLRPDDPSTHHLKARAHMQLQEWDAAQDHLETTVTLCAQLRQRTGDPLAARFEADAHRLLSQLAERRGDAAGVERHRRAAAALVP